MTDSMNFGPEWIRNLSSEGATMSNSIGGGGGTGGSSISAGAGVRYQLAEHRYGREEMLALFDKSIKPPNHLTNFKHVYSEQTLIPLALLPSNDDDGWPPNRGSILSRGRGGVSGGGGGNHINVLERGGGNSAVFTTSSNRLQSRGRGGGGGTGSTYNRPNSSSLYDSQNSGGGGDLPEWSTRKDFGGIGGGSSGASNHVQRSLASTQENWRRNRPHTSGSSSANNSSNHHHGDEDADSWRHPGGGANTMSIREKWPRGPPSTASSWRLTDHHSTSTNATNHPENSTATSNSKGSSSSVAAGPRGNWHELPHRNSSLGGSSGRHTQQQRTSWNGGDHHQQLPEWATTDATNDGGTFDERGAFHGADGLRKKQQLEADLKRPVNMESDVKKKPDEESLIDNTKIGEEVLPSTGTKSNETMQSQVNTSRAANVATVQSTSEEEFARFQEDLIVRLVETEDSTSDSTKTTASTAINSELIAPPPNLVASPAMVATSTAPITTITDQWYYTDPQGTRQGPFTNLEMAEWYKTGYFPNHLNVMRDCDERYYLLGDLVCMCGGKNPFLSGYRFAPLKLEGAAASPVLQQLPSQQQPPTQIADNTSAASKMAIPPSPLMVDHHQHQHTGYNLMTTAQTYQQPQQQHYAPLPPPVPPPHLPQQATNSTDWLRGVLLSNTSESQYLAAAQLATNNSVAAAVGGGSNPVASTATPATGAGPSPLMYLLNQMQQNPKQPILEKPFATNHYDPITQMQLSGLQALQHRLVAASSGPVTTAQPSIGGEQQQQPPPPTPQQQQQQRFPPPLSITNNSKVDTNQAGGEALASFFMQYQQLNNQQAQPPHIEHDLWTQKIQQAQFHHVPQSHHHQQQQQIGLGPTPQPPPPEWQHLHQHQQPQQHHHLNHHHLQQEPPLPTPPIQVPSWNIQQQQNEKFKAQEEEEQRRRLLQHQQQEEEKLRRRIALEEQEKLRLQEEQKAVAAALLLEEKQRKETEQRVRKELEKVKKEADKKRAKEQEEKKRLKELKKAEEAARKAAAAEEEQHKLLLLQEEKLRQVKREKQQPVKNAAKPAPWSQPVVSQSISLSDIQRAEKEKRAQEQLQMQLQQQELQQRQFQLQQQQNDLKPLSWAKLPSLETVKVKSLAEIQAEEQERLARIAMDTHVQLMNKEKETAAVTAATRSALAKNMTGSIWNGQSLSWAKSSANNQQTTSVGFWDSATAAVAATAGKSVPPSTKHSPKAATGLQKNQQSQAPPSAASFSSGGAKGKTKKNDNNNNNKKDTDEFMGWCQKALSNVKTEVDIPIFVSFLRDIESAYEVREYCKEYLGEGQATQQFTNNFLEKRRQYKPKANNNCHMNMFSPAPAVTSSVGGGGAGGSNSHNTMQQQHSAEFQEVKGKNKKNRKSKAANSAKSSHNNNEGITFWCTMSPCRLFTRDRYTKNLSADKINLSTFKGEGELSNLELNENVLTDLLELPLWLRLTAAWCNRVQFKIPWRKLKTVPMLLNLDEISVTVETCEELRPFQAGSSGGNGGGGNGGGGVTAPTDFVLGEYGFIHKVIDGITITVNNVIVTFNSRAFTANVQISRILVESRTAKWTGCSDLRMSRLKDSKRGQILVFKELQWQTVRIEAKSILDPDLTPLRLLTNQARCRIVIKKRLKDCFIIGSKLVMILDDLLWVLTDSQLKAALHFVDSLAGLVRKATLLANQMKAARKLEAYPDYCYNQNNTNDSNDGAVLPIFDLYDVVETSYHFVSNEIVLHLCDDDSGGGRSIHPHLREGSALHIALKRFQVDFFPYHLAGASRTHWPRYKSGTAAALPPHAIWQEATLAAFRRQFHAYAESCHAQQLNSLKDMKRQIDSRLVKLLTTCVVLRIEDFVLYKVTTSGRKQDLKQFVAARLGRKVKQVTGDREYLALPKDANIVHAEFIYYYYPSDSPFPLPPPKLYAQLHPIQVHFDVDTCIWLNAFLINLYESLSGTRTELPANSTYVDVKIEVILPRLLFETASPVPPAQYKQRDRPTMLSFEVTRITVTNVRQLESPSSRADLAKCVDGLQMAGSRQLHQVVTQKLLEHISSKDNIRARPPANCDLLHDLQRDSFWLDAKDVWCIHLEPISGDFFGARAIGSTKSVPFIYAVPATLWVHTSLDPNSTMARRKHAEIHAIAHISNLISVQLNHYQYLFLLRLAEDLSELVTFMSLDTKRILKTENSNTIMMAALLPQIEVSFVMPSCRPGKECSSSGGGGGASGDAESIVLAEDSTTSSIPDVTNRTSTNTSGSTTTLHSTFVPASRSMDAVMSTSPTAVRPGRPQPSAPTPLMSSMKKGISNFMSSLDNTIIKPLEDAASDTMSTLSDGAGSSDSEVPLSRMEADAVFMDRMFCVLHNTSAASASDVMGGGGPHPIEIASEVLEDDVEEDDSSLEVEGGTSSTPTSEFGNTCGAISLPTKRKDLVSVSMYTLVKVEFVQQSVGYETTISIRIGDMSCENCTAIPWDEFQTKFLSRSRGWTSPTGTSSPTGSSLTASKIRVKFNQDLLLPQNAATRDTTTSSRLSTDDDLERKQQLRRFYRNNLQVGVVDLSLNLIMSTLIGLGDLVEDEIIPVPIPMKVNLSNIQLEIVEDRPPANITSPGAVPINLHIHQMVIHRNLDGIFNFEAIPPTEEKQQLTSVGQQQNPSINIDLLTELNELRHRLTPYERIIEENHQLRRSNDEIGQLKTCLAAAQDDNARLLEEKQRLLEELHQMRHSSSIQSRNSISGGSRQWSLKR